MKRIALIPGDGIGEVTRQAVRMLDRSRAQDALPMVTEPVDCGGDRCPATGVATTVEEMARLEREFDPILPGALGDPRVPGNERARAILPGLRFRPGLCINLRPARHFETWLSPLRDVRAGDVDLVISCENTEGVRAGLGGQPRSGSPHPDHRPRRRPGSRRAGQDSPSPRAGPRPRGRCSAKRPRSI